MWALGHPDGDRAVLAAQTRGARRVRSALPALRGWLEQLARSESFMVREEAQRALA